MRAIWFGFGNRSAKTCSHGTGFWTAFIDVLRRVGYDDALVIENEDASVTPHEGVELGAAFMRPLLAAAAPAT